MQAGTPPSALHSSMHERSDEERPAGTPKHWLAHEALGEGVQPAGQAAAVTAIVSMRPKTAGLNCCATRWRVKVGPISDAQRMCGIANPGV